MDEQRINAEFETIKRDGERIRLIERPDFNSFFFNSTKVTRRLVFSLFLITVGYYLFLCSEGKEPKLIYTIIGGLFGLGALKYIVDYILCKNILYIFTNKRILIKRLFNTKWKTINYFIISETSLNQNRIHKYYNTGIIKIYFANCFVRVNRFSASNEKRITLLDGHEHERIYDTLRDVKNSNELANQIKEWAKESNEKDNNK